MKWYWEIYFFFKYFDMRLLNLWRRITWGFWPKDFWDLAQSHAKWILPRLKKLKEKQHGYPADLTERDWDIILTKMILAFALIKDKGCDSLDLTEQADSMVKEGLDLYRKYYFDLWD